MVDQPDALDDAPEDADPKQAYRAAYDAWQRQLAGVHALLLEGQRLPPEQIKGNGVSSFLDAVDTVFKQPEAFKGLTADPTWTVHQALPDAAPGPLPDSVTSTITADQTFGLAIQLIQFGRAA